jgi:hypothetical protein
LGSLACLVINDLSSVTFHPIAATMNRELKAEQGTPVENVNRRRGELTRNPKEVSAVP